MEKQKRLLSLDIARGFDMFFIMGVEELGTVLFNLLGWGWMAKQMHHPYCSSRCSGLPSSFR